MYTGISLLGLQNQCSDADLPLANPDHKPDPNPGPYPDPGPDPNAHILSRHGQLVHMRMYYYTYNYMHTNIIHLHKLYIRTL